MALHGDIAVAVELSEFVHVCVILSQLQRAVPTFHIQCPAPGTQWHLCPVGGIHRHFALLPRAAEVYVRTIAFDARVGVIGVMNPFIVKETLVPAAMLDF